MAKRPIAAVTQDFAGVLSFLKTRGFVPDAPSGQMIALARRMHRATYSLILWKFRLTKIPEHGAVFVEEIASDALQILPQAIMGYGKTTNLLTRGVIENAMRHLYFLDHRIEFERMNREHKWYVNVEELFQYSITHPIFLDTERRFDAINKLKTLYGELSASVHGRRVADLEMRAALRRIEYSEQAFRKQVASVEACAASVNFVLVALHSTQFNRFHATDGQIVLDSMPPQARRVLHDIS